MTPIPISSAEQMDSWLPFSGPVAKYNDYLVEAQLEKKDKTILAKAGKAIGGQKFKHFGQYLLSRVIATTVFPVCTVLDGAANLLRCPVELIKKAFGGNQESGLRAQKCIDDVFKCVRGTLGSPAGIVSPDLITRHFVPKTPRTGFVEAGGKLHYAEGTPRYPQSTQDVMDLVKEAKDDKGRICVIGGHFSQNKGYLSDKPNTIYIDTCKLNSVEIVADNLKSGEKPYAKVGAGATWGHIQNLADKRGLSTQVQQASNVFSVGGSLSVNCHGWDHVSGTLSETVRSVTIINADGKEETLHKGDEKLKYVLGGYGLCGVIVSAEIELTQNETVYSWGEEVAFDNYPQFFKDQILSHPNEHKMHLFRLELTPGRLLKTGVSQTYSNKLPKKTEKTGLEVNSPPHSPKSSSSKIRTEGMGVTPALTEEPLPGNLIDRILIHVARTLGLARSAYWRIEKGNMLNVTKTSRNEAMRPPIRAAFNNSRADAEWLQEYFVPVDRLEEILEKLGNLLNKNDVDLLNASVRYVKKDTNTALPYAPDDRFAIVLFFNQSLAPEEVAKTKAWVKEMIDNVNEAGGTYYLPYQHFADKTQFEESYGKANIAAFNVKKDEYDPNHLFYNGIYSDYIETEKSKKADVTAIEAAAKVEKEKKKTELDGRLNTFREIYSNPEKIRRFNLFLKNVFLQLDPEKFTPIVQELLKEHTSYDTFYPALLEEIGEAKEGFFANTATQLEALKVIQSTLSSQTETLMGGKNHTIDGYAEIGYQGRMMNAYQKMSGFKFKGPSYVVNDRTEGPADFIECGFPRPYKTFVPLGNYTPLTNDIPRESLELVVCPIGLHHVPPEHLDVYVKSIADVLKNGGSFILRDHDADKETFPIANLAHSVFNAGTGVTWNEESNEIRNFQDLPFWIDLLKKHGLELEGDPLITDKGHVVKEDSSMNALMRFTKKAPPTASIEKQVEELEQAMMLSDPNFKRTEESTYLTSDEWFLVEMAKEYAEHCKTKPAHTFPFAKYKQTINTLSKESIENAKKHVDNKTVENSEYASMTQFMDTVTSVEMVVKNVLSYPLIAASGIEEREISRVVAKTAEDYASFINHTPFYQFPYFSQIGGLWKAVFANGITAAPSNTYIALINTIDLVGKGILALPIRATFKDSEPGEIYMIIQDQKNVINDDWVRKQVHYAANDTKKEHPLFPTIVKEAANGLKVIKAPRYRPFTAIMKDLGEKGVTVHSVAGQKNIQIKIKAPKDKESGLQTIPHSEYLGIIPIPIDESTNPQEFVRLDAKIAHLPTILAGIKEAGGEVVYLHDF